MIRSFVRRLAGIMLVAFLSIFVWQMNVKVEKKKEAAARISRLPALALTDLQGHRIAEKTRPGQPLWLIFFHTTCDYCQIEAENIRQKGDFDRIAIWMVSEEHPEKLSIFSRRYDLNTRRNIRFFSDSSKMSHQIFDVTSVPSSFLYDAGGKLVKSYRGVVRTDTIVNALSRR